MSPTERYSLVLSLGVVVVALALLAWQWVERHGRSPVQNVEDATYFARREWRRLAVSMVMLALAAGLFFGSRMAHRVNGQPNALFLQTWLSVFVLVLALLVLAMVDWLATRSYARRQRSAMTREGMELLREEWNVRRQGADTGQVQNETNGSAHS